MLAIINGKIYTMKDKVLEKGTLLIEDGKIKDVGQNIELPKCESNRCSGEMCFSGLY